MNIKGTVFVHVTLMPTLFCMDGAWERERERDE